jgi:hypothetical protein
MIKNNTFQSVVNGIRVHSLGESRYCNSTRPLTAYGRSSPSIVNNVFKDISGSSVIFTRGNSLVRSSVPRLVNNTFYSVNQGISTINPYDVHIQNNIFANVTTSAVERTGSSSGDVTYNYFHANGSDFVGYPISYGQVVWNHPVTDAPADIAFNTIGIDPMFADVSSIDPVAWDLHLQAGSLAMEGGINEAPKIAPVDADRKLRIIDGDLDGGAFVDVGAYEYGPDDNDTDNIPDANDNCILVDNPNQSDTDGDGIGNICDCDFNQDNFCGGPDFTIFIGCFNAPTGGDPVCEAADMNGDDFVGGPDFSLFIGGFNGAPGPSGLVP